jgi:hypothetical protein
MNGFKSHLRLVPSPALIAAIERVQQKVGLMPPRMTQAFESADQFHVGDTIEMQDGIAPVRVVARHWERDGNSYRLALKLDLDTPAVP